jgi:hypothetical protein
MKGRLLIGVALAMYLAVVGCVVWPSGSAAVKTGEAESAESHLPRAKLEGLPLRGVAVQLQEVRNIEPYFKALDEIAAIGADTVEFVVSARMENAGNSRIFIDQRYCPSPAQLRELIALPPHRSATVSGIDATSPSWARARSRFWSGRTTR